MPVRHPCVTFASVSKNVNNKAREYFTMALDYLGIPSTLNSLERCGKQEIFFQKLCLYFKQWLKEYHGNSIAEKEMTILKKNDLESLGMDAREKLRSFLKSMEDICNSSLEADKPLLQIITELHTTCLE